MRSLLNCLAALAVLVPSAGCGLYFGAGDPPPDAGPCQYGEDLATYRNPQDGTCQAFGGGNPCNVGEGAAPRAQPDWAFCGSSCEALDENSCLAASGCRAAYQDLGVAPCPLDVPCDPTPSKFLGCWGTAPSGPISSGSCAGLDAQSCSEHDNCTAHYVDTGFAPDSAGLQQALSFNGCLDEQPQGGSCATVDIGCPVGTHCEDVCTPQPCGDGTGSGSAGTGSGSANPVDGGMGGGSGAGDAGTGGGSGASDGGVPVGGGCYPTCIPDAPQTCDQIACPVGSHCQLDCAPCDPTNPDPRCMSTCYPSCVPDYPSCGAVDCGPGYECVEACTGGMPGDPNTGSCTTECVPVTPPGPGDCIGPISCDAAPPACPAGSVAGIANGCYTGYCIPVAACGPRDPGTCAGTVSCATPPPQCPMGTVAGIANGCWSGFCIPDAACPPATCEQLPDEASCQARPDCTPIYQGLDCTCTPAGCTCASEIYETCRGYATQPPVFKTKSGKVLGAVRHAASKPGSNHH
jgi:hypothetical protein